MTPLLLVNENFPAPALKHLRAAGFDVVAVTEEMPGATDRVVLERARELGRWLVTFDRDYGERDQPTPKLAGVGWSRSTATMANWCFCTNCRPRPRLFSSGKSLSHPMPRRNGWPACCQIQP